MPSAPRLPPGRLSQAVGQIIREEIEDQGLSQQHLADQVGISQTQISSYLRAEKAMLLEEADLICRALGLELVDVLAAAKQR